MLKTAIIIVALILLLVMIICISALNRKQNGQIKHSDNPYEKNGVYNPPEQHIRILKDSLDLMEKTSNPETYFSREKLVVEKALYCINEPQIVWSNLTCRQIYDVFTTPEKKASVDRTLIDKLFREGKEDLLVFQMQQVGGYMLKETLDYFVRRLNGKRYHFCKVRFDDSGRLYTYVAKDPAIKQGDLVTVPTGNAFDKSTKLKQVVEAYDAPLDTLGFPINLLRCIEDRVKGTTVEERIVSMNLIKLECPNCGAALQVNDQLKSCTCNFCGHTFIIGSDSGDASTAKQPTSKTVEGVKGVPREYINALHEAYDYSTEQHMSKQDIYDTLTDAEYGDGFTPEAAQCAVDNMNVDWFQNALDKAKSYYFDDSQGWSKKEIYEELTDMEYGGKFTLEQAQYAIDHLDD